MRKQRLIPLSAASTFSARLCDAHNPLVQVESYSKAQSDGGLRHVTWADRTSNVIDKALKCHHGDETSLLNGCGRPFESVGRGPLNKEFLQTLYTTALEVLGRFSNSLYLKVGALYLIYVLFETQPGSHKQRVRIYMSPEDLTAFRVLVTEACQQNLADAAMIASHLVQSGALLLGAVHNRLTGDALRDPAAMIQRLKERLLPNAMLEDHFASSVGDSLPLSQVDQDARNYNEARKRLVAAKHGPLAETEDPPYLSMAEDLLRTSAALDRTVRATLATPARPTARRSATPAADNSARVETPADVSTNLDHVSARLDEVGRRTDPRADVSGGDGPETEAVAPLPGFITDLSLPMQSMPSIPGMPGLTSAMTEPMEVERLESPSRVEDEDLDEDELRREMDALEAVDEEEHPDPTASNAPGPNRRSSEQDAWRSIPGRQHQDIDGRIEPAEKQMNGRVLGNHASNGREDESRAVLTGERMEEEDGNGVLDRRRTGFSEEEFNSDEDVDFRRPLPRAHSPLR
ncbi:putative Small nuclear RNA activating complex (SNAPc) subunit SNAP43 protein [Klebsormidium nitens]|uniref:Putative Small nuclear RNA activating complex (SNAPc) subunit SNAP43 protein n=1 Tax=Klebsormidium nitens TaxID=105231 RepID=A0A1Y1I7D9_KLENI|nr:putative Small nuclear RNA activating complex (SNAPc) subunit SNAP43 protein [Klebsormidium nitens]|eukprot:GAQ84636.1 putative Small nuclear RNA activating complex (SNAPc) subunit SNAP43 protein [Klebsormidium nitens]